jgi:NitT/TauT family transport system permease protein
MLLARFRYLAQISEPYLAALYALPLVFFYPLLLALFGLGAKPIVIIATTMAFVPTAVSTRIGLTEVPEIYRRLARSVGASRLDLYRKVLFPAAVPFVFAGLKMGFVYALIGSVAMEFVLTDSGLGFAVRYNYNFFNAREMYAFVLLILLIAIALNAVLLRGEDASPRRPM